MASFVSFSKEGDQLNDLGKFVNRLLNKGKETPSETFEQDVAKLVEDKKYTDVLNKLIDEHTNNHAAFSDASEKDIEAFFLILVSLSKQLGGQQVNTLLSKLVTSITSSTDDKALLRLKILNDLYNIVDDNQFRFNLYISILKYAHASHNPEVAVRELLRNENLNNRIKQLGLSVEQTRTLYKAIREILKDSGRSLESYQFGVKYLSTFTSSDESQSQEAATVILEAIRLPEVLQYDTLLDIPVIKQLENSKNHSKVYSLLKIFVAENIEAYKTFSSQNADFMKSLELREEECIFKMRLLSLATLGSANQEISYALIAKTLQIDESEVESWIITAISDGVVEAKMDQLKRLVTVSRSLHRVFGQAQWKNLSDSLSVWRNNTKTLLKTLQETKQHYLNSLQQQVQHS